MVDVTEYIQSNFVKADNEWTNRVVAIVTKPDWVVSQKFHGTKQLVADVQSDGKTYKLGINKSNATRLAKAWGNNTDAWVGKKVNTMVAAQVLNGEIKKVLVLEPEGA